MNAVILAAGRGGRLRDVTGNAPKCLARIGPATLIEHQIAALRSCGVDNITVVAGYHLDEVRRVCGRGVNLVNNARFAATNSLYSLWLARDVLTDGFVVLNCDVLFDEQLLDDLMSARYDDALLVCARGDDCYSDEEMKVQIRAGRVVHISKAIASSDADAENVGIGKFGPDGAAVLVEELNRLVAHGDLRQWVPAAFDAFCRRRPLFAVETRGFPWIEIDFPEDYWRACAEILPAIGAGHRRGTRRPLAVAAGRPLHHV
jgi:L-glutamine-phosphate cytidylyltransferase